MTKYNFCNNKKYKFGDPDSIFSGKKSIYIQEERELREITSYKSLERLALTRKCARTSCRVMENKFSKMTFSLG